MRVALTSTPHLYVFGSAAFADEMRLCRCPTSLQNALSPLRLLTHATRWRIVTRLAGRSLCVSDLVAILELRQSNLSNHLKLMREAGLLDTERRGPMRFYCVARRFHGLLLLMRTSLRVTEASDPLLGADAWNSQRALRV